MRERRQFRNGALVGAFAVIAASPAFAGDIQAARSVRINDVMTVDRWGSLIERASPTLAPGERFELCARFSFYHYTPEMLMEANMVLEIRGGFSIGESVGKGGRNVPEDVRSAAAALTQALPDFDGASIDPRQGGDLDRLGEAVEKFQRAAGLRGVDGRIDPGGATARALSQRLGGGSAKRDLMFLETLRPGAPEGRNDREGKDYCVSLRAPTGDGAYRILGNELPMFTAVGLSESAIAEAMEAHRGPWHDLGVIKVDGSAPAERTPYSMALAVDGKRPAAIGDENIGGARDTPLEITWVTRPRGPEPQAVQFRHRMLPEETDWSLWTDKMSQTFTYLGKGSHVFQVQSRYDAGAGWSEAGVAEFSFNLAKPLTVRAGKGLTPVAAGAPRPQSAASPDWLQTLYPRSRAFVTGVQNYDVPTVPDLLYVDNDVAGVTEALAGAGFDVAEQPLDQKRDAMLAGLEAFINETQRGDRIVLYFSMHGFSSREDALDPYLAPADCDFDAPDGGCLRLSVVEDLVARAMEKGAQHVLVTLDSCSSGMGVMGKLTKAVPATTAFVERAVGEAPGAHVMTAGLADQVAYIDETGTKQSFFTHHFIRGLNGEGDLNGDGVVTIAELAPFVRYEVAKATDSEQTPMMGRLAGAGEMMFAAPPAE